MSCQDDDDDTGADGIRISNRQLIAEAIANATEFLFEACPGPATCITKGVDGQFGAIFVLKDPDDVSAFMKLYVENFQETKPEYIGDTLPNVPPDYESN